MNSRYIVTGLSKRCHPLYLALDEDSLENEYRWSTCMNDALFFKSSDDAKHALGYGEISASKLIDGKADIKIYKCKFCPEITYHA